MPRSTWSGFLKAALITFGILVAVVLGVGIMIYRALTDFDSRRDMMALRGGLEVRDDETLDVGYVDNGDGTLTVYIYWFEV